MEGVVSPGEISLRGIGLGLGIGLILFGFLAELGAAASQKGGTYRSSMATDLTNLDLHKTQAQIDNAVLGMTVYEPLFTYDEKFNVKPFLCESYKMSPDGLDTHPQPQERGRNFTTRRR